MKRVLWLAWLFSRPAHLFGYSLTYHLARLAGWRHQYRAHPSLVKRFWTVRRGHLHIVDTAFRWSDFFVKPPYFHCQSCARREGHKHSALCADQNVLHPDGTTVEPPEPSPVMDWKTDRRWR